MFIYHYETVIISYLKNHCERSLVSRLERNQVYRLKCGRLLYEYLERFFLVLLFYDLNCDKTL